MLFRDISIICKVLKQAKKERRLIKNSRKGHLHWFQRPTVQPRSNHPFIVPDATDQVKIKLHPPTHWRRHQGSLLFALQSLVRTSISVSRTHLKLPRARDLN